MANASDPTATIRPEEAEHFGKLAADWWNPRGSSAMLHRLNPVRLRYIRDRIDAHWGIAAQERHPLAGKCALDVGCGAGLLCEPLARMGAAVTGVDAAVENIGAAREHAAAGGLSITYHAGELAGLGAGTFDLVTSMEVIEHVADPVAFIAQLAARVAPGGLMILSTPNRTALSKLLLVEAAERVGAVPRGTHDWSMFVKPAELEEMVDAAGMRVLDTTALSPSLATGFKLGGTDALNYLMTAVAK